VVVLGARLMYQNAPFRDGRHSEIGAASLFLVTV
jgi:hypothetical protein